MFVGMAIVGFLGFLLGCRYSDFRDLMLARRVARMITQARKLDELDPMYAAEFERQVRGGLVDRSIRGIARARKNVSDDAARPEADEKGP